MPQQQLSWMYWGGNVMAVLMIAWVEQGECFQRVSRYLMPFAIHVQTSGNLSDSNTAIRQVPTCQQHNFLHLSCGRAKATKKY
jgi:hypothetical protein